MPKQPITQSLTTAHQLAALTDSNRAITLNNWMGLVAEVYQDQEYQGVVVFFPGVTHAQLKKG